MIFSLDPNSFKHDQRFFAPITPRLATFFNYFYVPLKIHKLAKYDKMNKNKYIDFIVLCTVQIDP